MMLTVPITEFRRGLFKYADLVNQEGYEIEVENKGKSVFKIVKVQDNPQERAKRALAILPKIAGKLGDTDKKFFRGKKEIEYMKKLGLQW